MTERTSAGAGQTSARKTGRPPDPGRRGYGGRATSAPPATGRRGERFDDDRTGIGAIERLLDGDDVGIVGGRLNELGDC